MSFVTQPNVVFDTLNYIVMNNLSITVVIIHNDVSKTRICKVPKNFVTGLMYSTLILFLLNILRFLKTF